MSQPHSKVVVVLACLALAACGTGAASQSQSIVGTWKSEQTVPKVIHPGDFYVLQVTFNGASTMTMTDIVAALVPQQYLQNLKPHTITMIYKNEGHGKLMLTQNGQGGEAPYKIQDGKLYLTLPQGVFVFDRASQ